VRLAALDLREDSGVDLKGSGMDPGFLGFRVHLNSRVSHFLRNVTFLCKFVSNSMSMSCQPVDCMTSSTRLRVELGIGIGASPVTVPARGARAYLRLWLRTPC